MGHHPNPKYSFLVKQLNGFEYGKTINRPHHQKYEMHLLNNHDFDDLIIKQLQFPSVQLDG